MNDNKRNQQKNLKLKAYVRANVNKYTFEEFVRKYRAFKTKRRTLNLCKFNVLYYFIF